MGGPSRRCPLSTRIWITSCSVRSPRRESNSQSDRHQELPQSAALRCQQDLGCQYQPGTNMSQECTTSICGNRLNRCKHGKKPYTKSSKKAVPVRFVVSHIN